jgi:hypothetical protein
MQLRYPLLWSVIVLLSSAHVHSAALAQPTAKKPDKQYTIELSGGIPLDTGLYAVVGQRHQLQAALVKHGRKEISATFEWKSSDPAVAAVVDG